MVPANGVTLEPLLCMCNEQVVHDTVTVTRYKHFTQNPLTLADGLLAAASQEPAHCLQPC